MAAETQVRSIDAQIAGHALAEATSLARLRDEHGGAVTTD